MFRTFAAALALGLLSAGAAHADSAWVTLVRNGRATELSLGPDGYGGPLAQLTREGSTVRGLVARKAVQAELEPGRVHGNLGQGGLDLRVERSGDVVKVHGTFAGALSDIALGKESIQGNVGACSYDLSAKADGSYAGNSSCGGPAVPTTLAVPAELAQRPDSEQVLVLALVLGSGSDAGAMRIRPHRPVSTYAPQMPPKVYLPREARTPPPKGK